LTERLTDLFIYLPTYWWIHRLNGRLNGQQTNRVTDVLFNRENVPLDGWLTHRITEQQTD